MQNKTVALITAAGSGLRLGLSGNKVFYQYRNKTVLDYTLTVFQNSSDIQSIVLILSKQDFPLYAERLKESYNKIKHILTGGASRQESVFKGLQYLQSVCSDETIVLIHDGARPFVKSRKFSELIKKVENNTGAVLGVRMRDTVKEAVNGRVKRTVDRTDLYQIQTPQVFLLTDIYQAYRTNGDKAVTDDAQVFETSGGIVEIIESDRFNFKLTYPDDLELLKIIIDAE